LDYLPQVNPADHSRFQHSHNFVRDFSKGESRTRIVIAITAVMMVVEIAAGWLFHSMALLADGWHMSTHVIAFVITALAYYFTRRHASNVQFSFGTGKIGVLGGFSSAVVLSVVAFLMAGESIHRLFVPLEIHFNEAILIAFVALTVNLVCALLLKGAHHDHAHHHHPPSPGYGVAGDHHHGDDHDHVHEHDLNLRAAYLHVVPCNCRLNVGQISRLGLARSGRRIDR
jgi:cation diffusion facilitator family transporter